MCTLIIGFYPKAKIPLVIGFNRDENPTRPSEDWCLRENETILSPLDVRGGTWVGVNSSEMFCAITNWDLQLGLHNKISKGLLVYNILKSTSITEAYNYCKSISSLDYKPFNIVFGNSCELYVFSNNHYRTHITSLTAGLYISTGIGFNTSTARTDFIRKELSNSFTFDQPVTSKLAPILSSHNSGIWCEDSVCVHDPEHQWDTISSAVITLNNTGNKFWKINSTNKQPCLPSHYYQWSNFTLPIK
jgi:uncharacterized protein with NRDE domain